MRFNIRQIAQSRTQRDCPCHMTYTDLSTSDHHHHLIISADNLNTAQSDFYSTLVLLHGSTTKVYKHFRTTLTQAQLSVFILFSV